MGFELPLTQLRNPAYLGLNRLKAPKNTRFTVPVTAIVTTKLGLKLGQIS